MRGAGWLVALILALTACDAREGASTGPAPSAEGSDVSSVPSAPPSMEPYFRTGEASVTVGDRHVALQLGRTVPSTFEGGAISLYYGDPVAGEFLQIAGQAGVGEVRTGPGLALSLGDGTTRASALGDECTVTFEEISPAAVRGGFTCRKLASPGGKVDASGTFTAGR